MHTTWPRYCGGISFKSFHSTSNLWSGAKVVGGLPSICLFVGPNGVKPFLLHVLAKKGGDLQFDSWAHLVLWLTSNKGICRGNSGVQGQCHARQLGLIKPVKFAKYDIFCLICLQKTKVTHITLFFCRRQLQYYQQWRVLCNMGHPPFTILQLIWWPFQRTLMQVRYSSSIDGNPQASIVFKKITANDFQLTPIFVCLTKYIIQGSNDADTQHHISSSIW